MPSNQFWKKPFKKTGYPEEIIPVSTTGKVIGDYIVLNRGFFKLEGTKIEYLDGTVYKGATIGIKDEMLLARDKDTELSADLGINVYTRLQLNHRNVTNTILKIKYSPFGDIIDPAEFGQSLTPDSDVEHKNLLLKNKLISKKVQTEEIVTKTIMTNHLNTEELEANSIKLGELKEELKYEAPFLKIAGKTFPHIDPKSLIPSNALTLMVLSPKNLIELIPISWLKVDHITLDIEINGVKIKEKLAELEAKIEDLSKEINKK